MIQLFSRELACKEWKLHLRQKYNASVTVERVLIIITIIKIIISRLKYKPLSNPKFWSMLKYNLQQGELAYIKICRA